MWWLVVPIAFIILLGFAIIRAIIIKADPPQPRLEAPSGKELERAGIVLSEMVQKPTISHVDGHEDDLAPFFEFQDVLTRHFPLLHHHLSKEVIDGSLIYCWQNSNRGRESSTDTATPATKMKFNNHSSGSDEHLVADKIKPTFDRKSKQDTKKPILLIAHQDVVPATAEGWRFPPFSGTLSEGSVWGRGALDCKSMIYAILEGIEQLLSENFTPSCDIWLAFSTNEETSGAGAPTISRIFEERGLYFRLVLDEGGAVLEDALPGMDRPFAMIGVAEKGYLDLKITAQGSGGHSSTPPDNTPLARLARFITAIERKPPFKKVLSRETRAMMRATAPSLPFLLRFLFGNLWLTAPLIKFALPRVSTFGRAMLATTCTFTMAEGSEASNVIPNEASVIANLRPATHQGVDASLAALHPLLKKNELSADFLIAQEPSPVSDITDPRYQDFVAVIKDCFPDCGVSPYLVMGGTDARNYTNVSDMVLRFQPIRMTQEELGAMHGIDERISVQSVAEGAVFIKQLIKKLC
ncbi:MAG TPA: M20/M25/M40 family metallo-hydrolase [Clostridiaceae bacterium]|nr:M20/M25/M40 family metallo-hydrolase [Clostridiaceae bacterium]